MREIKTALLLAAAALITALVIIQPVSAQSNGVGCDGNTRFIWKASDSSISLWKLDSNLNLIGSHVYGPYDGWLPIGMTTACNNSTYVLWLRTDGLVTIWQVDSNLNFVTSQVYGPYFGWIPESLSADTTANSTLRLLWRETGGQVSVWYLLPNLNYVKNGTYGPFFGYVPGGDSRSSGSVSAESAAADTKASMAMTTEAPNSTPSQVK
jgi:hypothetical protein